MALIVPNGAEQDQLTRILSINLRLRLFTNNIISGLNAAAIEALVVGDFTEATFTGYASKLLSSGNWGIAAGDPAVATYNAAQIFSSSANQALQTVYGYYVTKDSDNSLQWFEYFTEPALFESNGDDKTLTPRYSFRDEND